MTKRLLFFSNHLRGPGGSAGARSWHQVCRISRDFEVDVIIPGIDPVSAKRVASGDYEGIDHSRVNVHLASGSENRRSSKLARAAYMITTAASQFAHGIRSRRPDVVLTMGLPLPTLATAWIIAKLRRAPLVIDVRDIPFEAAIELGYLSNNIGIRFLILTENFLLGQANAICTNSPRYVSILKEKGVDSERITVAPIGYDNFGFPSSETETSRTDKVRFTYAGTIGFAFPLDGIIRGVAESGAKDSIELVFIGDGQQLEDLKSLAKELEVSVQFLGRVPKARVHASILDTDICIYSGVPGKYSGAILGNKIFDYLGNGKPVLCVGEGLAVGDLISGSGAGLVVSSEVLAIAEAFRRIVTDEYLRTDILSEAMAYAASCPTATTSADQLAEILLEVAEV